MKPIILIAALLAFAATDNKRILLGLSIAALVGLTVCAVQEDRRRLKSGKEAGE